MSTVDICFKADVQSYPDLTFNGENYIVVWVNRRYTGNYYYWVAAARVTPQGTVLDTGNALGTGPSGTVREYTPDIAFDGSRCLAVWFNYYYAPLGVYGRFINSSAQPEGSIIQIASQPSSNSYTNPKVAFDNDNYLVIWSDNSTGNYDICGQFVAPDGQLVGGKITIATGSSNQRYHDLAFDGSDYLVVWSDGYRIYGQRVAKDGQLVGSEFLISNNTSNYRYYTNVAVSKSNYLAAWSERIGSYYDIYGNVDTPVGVEEGIPEWTEPLGSTIITGAILLPEGKSCKIYDITGREVRSARLKPGIYFIEVEGKVSQKLIKIR